jgi:hypothetical protein
MRSLPSDVVSIVDLVTLDNLYPPKIVGSYKYIVHEYPADIDLFEHIKACCNVPEATERIAKRVREIVHAVHVRPHTFLADFKAGSDDRYKIDIGDIKTKSVLREYQPHKIREDIRKLYQQGLLNNDEVKEWLAAVKDRATLGDFLHLESLVHEKSTIRWSAKDIQQGFKILTGNKRITLLQALAQKSIVKMDVWTLINGRFTEVTALYYVEVNGVPITKPLGNYMQSILNDVEYYRNPHLGKFMKFAKRLWTLGILTKNKRLLVSLYPLFSSGAAKMYQIMGEIETIRKMLTRYNQQVDVAAVHSNINEWKARLGTIMPDYLPTMTADRCYERIDKILGTVSYDLTLSLLDDLQSILEHRINKVVMRYLKRNRVLKWASRSLHIANASKE